MNSSLPKIKVCHVASGDLWAGAEVQLVILVRSLLKMEDFDICAILFNEGRLATELRSLGLGVWVIPESRHNPLAVVSKLSGYFRTHPVDIVHTHKPKDNVLGALSSAYAGIRLRVRTVHGFPEPHLGLRAIRNDLNEFVDRCVNTLLVDGILAVSSDLRGHLEKRFDPRKIVCVRNGIDVDHLVLNGSVEERRKRLQVPNDNFLIGTAGRLKLGKGFECFLGAARLIRNRRKNVKFIIVGDGPLRESLEGLAREYEMEDDVILVGYRHDIRDMLELFDILVLPSFSEGIPMVLLEALAQSRPVVATRVGGIPEVIEDGKSGLLVTPGMDDEIAQACIALMDDYNWAQELGTFGRKRVEASFSATSMAEGVAQFYRTLVASLPA